MWEVDGTRTFAGASRICLPLEMYFLIAHNSLFGSLYVPRFRTFHRKPVSMACCSGCCDALSDRSTFAEVMASPRVGRDWPLRLKNCCK